jgi:CRP/FNR family cyclic AMP-dependent transcriptional regulator
VFLDTPSTLEMDNMIGMIEAHHLGVEKRFRRGKVLFWQNDPVDSLFLVKTGKVKTSTLSEDGKNRIYGIWGRGTFLGTTSQFLNENHLMTAYVFQTADILIVSPADLKTMVMKEPACALSVIQYLAYFVKVFMREVDALSFLDVEERLKRNLESLAFQHGHDTSDGIEIDLNVTHEEIAELTSANRTTITGHLNNLKKQGYLWSSGRHLVIVPHDHIRILENLSEAVLAADSADANRWTGRAIKEKIDLVKLLDVLTRAVGEAGVGHASHIGKDLDVGKVVGVARSALETLLAQYVKPRQSPLGLVVIGTVQGDTHDLGKLMASILLARAGFGIVDLGINIGWGQFAEAVQENRASVLAMSSALTVDHQQQEIAREIFARSGLLKQATLVVGGAGFSKEIADKLGAAAYAGSVLNTVQLAKNLSERRLVSHFSAAK